MTESVRMRVKEQKLPIQIMDVTRGRARANPGLLQQIDLTATRQQRVETLIEATTTERQRAQEPIAKAAADNACRQHMGLASKQYPASRIAQVNTDVCAEAQACCRVPSATSVVARQPDRNEPSIAPPGRMRTAERGTRRRRRRRALHAMPCAGHHAPWWRLARKHVVH